MMCQRAPAGRSPRLAGGTTLQLHCTTALHHLLVVFDALLEVGLAVTNICAEHIPGGGAGWKGERVEEEEAGEAEGGVRA